MIGYLRGKLLPTFPLVTLDVNGVGYEVHAESPFQCTGTNEVALWVHEHAPQDAPHELYGFREREQRDRFRKLLDIKGVGPKVAMRVVASGIKFMVSQPGVEMRESDKLDWVTALRKIRGVGDKLAFAIVEGMR